MVKNIPHNLLSVGKLFSEDKVQFKANRFKIKCKKQNKKETYVQLIEPKNISNL